MGGNFTTTRTVVAGDDITADLWNGEFQNIIDNMTPDGVDDASSNVTAMTAVADPYPSATESLATDLTGEIQRLRYQILQIKKGYGPNISETKWYSDIPRIFGTIGSTSASAAHLEIAGDGNYFEISGTTDITSITDYGPGSRITVRFLGALVLTHNSSAIRLPGSQSIKVQIGDIAEFQEISAGVWQMVTYLPMNVNNPSSTALTLRDNGNNAFSSITTSWTIRYEGGRHYRLSINGQFITHASSSSQNCLKISGLGLTLDASGTPYIIGGFVKAYPTGEPVTWDSPAMIDSSEIQVRRVVGTSWGAAASYIFNLEILVPV